LVFFLFHFLPFLVRHHLQRRTTNRAHVRVLRGLKISNIEKKALVLILLVLVFTHKIKIKGDMFVYIQQSKWSEHVFSYWSAVLKVTQRVQPTCIIKTSRTSSCPSGASGTSTKSSKMSVQGPKEVGGSVACRAEACTANVWLISSDPSNPVFYVLKNKSYVTSVLHVHGTQLGQNDWRKRKKKKVEPAQQ
jgi:hypothetical protein